MTTQNVARFISKVANFTGATTMPTQDTIIVKCDKSDSVTIFLWIVTSL